MSSVGMHHVQLSAPLYAGFLVAPEERGAKVVAAFLANLVTSLSKSSSTVVLGVSSTAEVMRETKDERAELWVYVSTLGSWRGRDLRNLKFLAAHLCCLCFDLRLLLCTQICEACAPCIRLLCQNSGPWWM